MGYPLMYVTLTFSCWKKGLCSGESAWKKSCVDKIYTKDVLFTVFRLYMQLPLPTAHRYHHIGNSIEAFQKELDDHDEILIESLAVDSRVLDKVQELVRQGFVNPFIVRAGLKVMCI